MRVTTNSTSTTILREIQNLSTQQNKLQTEISSGQRITLPEDDPAAVTRVLNLQSESRQLTQYSANAGTAQDLAQSSYTGLKSLSDTATRATEIASLASGTMSASDMQSYSEEVNQLIEQALQVGNSKFNGDSLYAGTKTDSDAFTATRDSSGQVTAVTYNGNSSGVAIPLSANASVTPGTSGTTNSDMATMIGQLVTLRNALQSGDSAAVTATQTGLQTSEDSMISAIGANGGIQSRISAFQQQQTDRITNIGSLISDASSVDLSTAVVQLSQTQTAYQAALKSASTILQTSLLDYIK